jgi:hypothetical protein
MDEPRFVLLTGEAAELSSQQRAIEVAAGVARPGGSDVYLLPPAEKLAWFRLQFRIEELAHGGAGEFTTAKLAELEAEVG